MSMRGCAFGLLLAVSLLLPLCVAAQARDSDGPRETRPPVDYSLKSTRERVDLWLRVGGLYSSPDDPGGAVRDELIAHGLDAVPYLAEIVRRADGRRSRAAFDMLCAMDRFVPAERLQPEATWLKRLAESQNPAGLFDRSAMVDGRRIGSVGLEAVRWAAAQTRHDELRFHAREYSGLLDAEIRQLPTGEMFKRWRVFEAKGEGDWGMNEDSVSAVRLGYALEERPDEALALLTETLERDANPYLRYRALELIRRTDDVSVRLRGTPEGLRAIEAMRRALTRCEFKHKRLYMSRDECQRRLALVTAEQFEDSLLFAHMSYRWVDALETAYGLRLTSKDKLTDEARRFVAYLTEVDPRFPSWEMTYHHTWQDYALQQRFRVKLARYYEQWIRFKTQDSTTNR